MSETFTVPDELLARCVGRVDLAQRVVDTFVQQLKVDVPRLVELVREGEVEEAARMAHRIKGSSANVAAESLRKCAELIEQLAKQGDLADEQTELRELQKTWDDYVQQTESFLSQPQA